MRTTINIPDDIIKETEAIYKTNSRSKSIELALKDALKQKKLEQLKELVGKVEFDEKAIYETREKER
ncbi:MAG: type II toxin-antitoxin system VapB family antitoxin [Halanaerobiales bacterium]